MEGKFFTTFLFENLTGREYLVDLGIGGRNMVHCILNN
jgi:hypothetical protein